MKKILFTILGIFCFILLSIYTLLFTNIGNAFLKPRIEQLITQKSGLNVKFETFKINFSTLDIKANIDNNFFANIKGDISPLKLGFNINYLLGLNQNYIKNLGLRSDKDFTFKGDVIGKSSDFTIKGNGFLFDSNLSLNAKIVNFSPINLEFIGKNIDIAQVLDFANLPRYAQGKISIVSDIQAKDLKPNGNALIYFYTNSINNALIQKDFNLTLPKQSYIKGEIRSLIQENKLLSKSEILSNFFKLYTQKSIYDIQRQSLSSDFDIKLDDLDQFSSLAKIKLQGKSEIQGDLILANNQLQKLKANLLGFGGNIKALLENNILNISTNNIEIAELLKTISIPAFIDSKLILDLKSQGLDFSNFNLNTQINNANINTAEFKKFSGLDFPKTTFTLQAKADAKNSLINYEALLDSNIAKIPALKGSYHLINKDLKAQISAFIDNLNKLKPLTKQELNGPLNLDAKVDLKANQIQNLDANIKIMQGVINAVSNGKSLQAKISDIKLEQIFPLVGQKILAYGDINADVKLNSLDFTNLNGDFKANINSSFNDIELSKLLEKKFPKNTSAKINLDGKISKSIIDFNAKALSSFANINSFKGKFDLNQQALTSMYNISLQDFSKLGFLVERNLKGKADFEGKFDFKNNLIDASIVSKNIFNGILNATLKNNIFNATTQNTDLSNLAQSLDLPDFYQAKANLDINYNLLKESGVILMNLADGQLKKNLITNALMILLQKDITKDVYRNGQAKIDINKNIIDLNLNLLADRSKIDVNKGKIDTKSSRLNIPFNVIIDRANFKGIIKGTTQDPKVNLDTKSVINSIANTIGGNTSDAAKNTGKKVDQAIDKIFNKIF
ncbi:hypothetical protein IMC75_00485 [Campylobacter peloridis]|uniref:Periplasmic protein n=1 Tax=Campylobacter peloridis TaxID=488546 RepID=A0ABX6TSF8_9BACT|nr:hypothetical protein [Campylobacter peloridis]AJC84955.1 hypothetical protein CPEL_1140 [Campylobacter peloridis LMG 23910]QOQ88990.1 hypothetical protein IMC75_00485 [Campylobacter peloridis]